MWAHYAEGFTGICIAYSLPKLLDAVGQDASFVRVFYNEVPTVSRFGSEEAKMILSYRNYGWRYEREWRMFGSVGPMQYANSECVTRVYLGSRMTDENHNLITSRLCRLNVDIQDITIDKYSIGFEATS
jgi:hypothetical protein